MKQSMIRFGAALCLVLAFTSTMARADYEIVDDDADFAADVQDGAADGAAAQRGCVYKTVWIPGKTERVRVCFTDPKTHRRTCQYKNVHVPGSYQRVRVCN